MIRFRIGQSWKREAAARPIDAFGLDLDGVDLFAGASEEPLERVVADLADALYAVAVRGERAAEFGLPESHLEIVLRRSDADVEVEVVNLARPARRVKGPVRVDVGEFVEAAVSCIRALLRDVGEAAPDLHPEVRRALSKKAEALEQGPLHVAVPPREVRTRPLWHEPHGAAAFAFHLEDVDGRLSEYDGKGSGALASLLGPGTVSLVATGLAQPAWEHRGTPFLSALELARQAAELVHAIELDEPRWSCGIAGTATTLTVDLKSETFTIRGKKVSSPPAALARAMFELGEALAQALTAAHRPQARNPWLQELVERCREGMARLGATSPPADVRPARARGRRARKERPLHGTGRVRRLRFDLLWEKGGLVGNERGRILLARRGPLVSSPEMACAFSARGKLLYRHVGAHGVAAAADGWTLAAGLNRVLAFTSERENAGAVWLRDHDGTPIGPELVRRDGLCVVTSQGRNVLAFSEVTGREVWRLMPPRTQRGHLSVQGHRALLATDAGYLYGLDLADGQVRFRMRAAMPFAGPTIPWGRRLLATISRGDRSVVFVADAHTGAIAWTCELPLGAPSRPLVSGARILVAGERDREGILVCLSSRGRVLWERKLNLGTAPFSLMAVGRALLVTSHNGAAVLYSPDGVTEWRIGSAGEELATAIPPCLSRGVLFIPGEVTRAVDPGGGRILAEVRTGIGLVDLAVDPRLNLYALDEDGSLRAFRLTTTLAIVGGDL
ncbi:MAG: PQQ-binding-like beta-propeller repeat protein [Myxococcaceae bacterium]|nr:PQQ-binding-like beta-propeller repeat protein [Myxococcaceae bacterium]